VAQVSIKPGCCAALLMLSCTGRGEQSFGKALRGFRCGSYRIPQFLGCLGAWGPLQWSIMRVNKPLVPFDFMCTPYFPVNSVLQNDFPTYVTKNGRTYTYFPC
jgi:hypothetical protein